jgi:hypothetical protein
MILATKRGLLIVVDVLSETDGYVYIQERDGTVLGDKWTLSKTDKTCKLFDSVPEAEKWILGENNG